MVASGCLQVRRGELTAELAVGDLVNEYDCLIDGMRRSRVVAKADTRLFVINSMLMGLVAEDVKQKTKSLVRGLGEAELSTENSVAIKLDYSWHNEKVGLGVLMSDATMQLVSGELEVEVAGARLLLRRDGWVSFGLLAMMAPGLEVRMTMRSKELKAVVRRQAELRPADAYKNIIYGVLSAHKDISKMDRRSMMAIIDECVYRHYVPGEAVCKKDEHLNSLVVVLEGVAVQGERRFTSGQLLFEDTRNVSVRVDQAVFAQGRLVCGAMSIYKVAYALRNVYEDTDSIIGAADFAEIKKMMYVQHDNLYDEYIAKCGDGAFFAHVMNRQEVLDCGFEHQLRNEKAVYGVLRRIDVDGMCGMLVRRLVGKQSIVNVYKYVFGSSLRRVMRKLGCLSTPECLLLANSLLKCLRMLHENRICVRDLKPEAVMVRRDGRVLVHKLCASKLLEEHLSLFRPATMVGTPHYMSVEMIKREEYSYAIDVWSLGIMLYEMMTGVVPFGETTDDPLEVYEAVLYNKLAIPPIYSKPQYQEINSLIALMLDRDPVRRYEAVSRCIREDDDAYIVESWSFLGDLDLKVKKMLQLTGLKNLLDDQEVAHLLQQQSAENNLDSRF